MLLFKFKNSLNNFEIESKYKVAVFKPSLFQLNKHLHNISIMHVIWFFFTFGKYKIVYVYDGEKLIHYTHAIPKFWKFSFMSNNDLEIGPCWTDEKYRGQGIYPYIIQQITKKDIEDRNWFMIVDKNNIASIKGMEKAGFEKVGQVKKTKLLGIYKYE